MNSTSTMGSRIKKMRLQKGMTQEKLAELLYTSKALISQYENNKIDIKGSVIIGLANVLETTTGFILNGEITKESVSEEDSEFLKIISKMPNCHVKKIALEQMRLLVSLAEIEN